MIGSYEAYSGIEITKMLNQLVLYLTKGQSNTYEVKEKIETKFLKADSAKTGILPLSKVYQIFVKDLKLPKLST
jgi:hypothetical protein